jgi:hypothetical protein
MQGVFGFDSALLILKAGGKVRRLGWPREMWLHISHTLYRHHHGIPELAVYTQDGPMGFVATTYDLLATDWTAETHNLPKEENG